MSECISLERLTGFTELFVARKGMVISMKNKKFLQEITAWVLILSMVLTLSTEYRYTAAVEPPLLSDAESVEHDYRALTWDTIKNTNTKQMSVMNELTFPVIGQAGTTINWVSSDAYIITSGGMVNRQTEDSYVTLVATIAKGTATPCTKAFYVCVRGTSPGGVTDADAVANMKAALTWDAVKNGNLIPSRVVTNLFLPTQGLNGTDISWSSSLSAAINTAGEVQYNGNANVAARNVTLTATISRGAASDTVVFNLTVPERYDFLSHIRPSIGNEILYPTKDYVVSDFNVCSYGAITEPGFCNREAFQAAIDAAYAAGGGVVYIPSGTYEFYSEINGDKRGHSYNYVLNLREGVQLRGDWIDPDTSGGKVQGTILAVYAGHESPNCNTYKDTGEIENQTGLAMLTNVSDRFIQMERGTGVTNLSIWYPNQSIGGSAVKYPWTLFQTGGDSATLENITLVNSYNGFHSAPSELHYVLNSRITALETGIKIHNCTETGRIENVNIGDYWSRSGLPGAPNAAAVTNYTKTNAAGLEMHRSDWEYISYLSVTGYKTGLWVGRERYKIGGQNVLSGYAPNAQFYGLELQDCNTALYIDGVNGFGLLISDSKLEGDTAVFFDTEFDTAVQFNSVDFSGGIVSESKGGLGSFENCSFSGFNGISTVKVNSKMNLLLSQSEFTEPENHISKANNATVKSVNSGYNGVLSISGNTDNVSQIKNDAYTIEPISRDIKTNIDQHPKAGANNVLKAELPCVTGNNNDVPTVDVSEQLQNALNAVSDVGGGIVYLPGGRYLVNSPVTVPSGVELRGTWDTPHHTEGGGAAIFTTYGKSADGAGESLIQLKKGAGIRGLSVVQTNITDVAGFNDNSPFLIQGQDSNVYIINVTVPVGYRGIDLATCNTDGHYVDYFGGALLKAGIWVGGGDDGGFIRNIQFNPHYALRRPSDGQGYPSVSNAGSALYNYIQNNCSALLFTDVKNQTIFNSFIFGSVNGIHFKKDKKTGKAPGRITILGHGSDGCTYPVYVEDGDTDTKIVAVNSQLVNTSLTSQPERTYIKMGANTSADIHPETELIICNSSFWGSPTTGPIVNAGTLILRQANFYQMNGNNPGLNVNGGKLHTLNSNFAYERGVGYAPNQLYLSLAGEGAAELTNNCYRSNNGGGILQSERYSPNDHIIRVYGSDIADSYVEPYISIIAAKELIQSHTYTVTQTDAESNNAAKIIVETIIGGLPLNGVVFIVNDGEFTSAAAGTETNPYGTDGSYTFTVKLTLDGVEQTTDILTLNIKATPYFLYKSIYITAEKGYIELHNPTDYVVSTKGLYLSNNYDNPCFRKIPAVIMRKNSTIRININSDDIGTLLKRMHISFDLSLGKTLYLTDVIGEILFEVELV